ncbi:helix-turn-helix domain-containing protein [Streptomyces sp. URMC 123]|uniref:helix-turn-helix domain-containing protein n=1 Tax=Streptomyces sp. URMC 123 TaxID=3423403 RepID=UPI003F1AF705
MRSSPTADAAALFGQRLQRLVDLVLPDGRRRYTDAEIAAYVGVTAQYVSKLRKGRSIPNAQKALRLAEFFEINGIEYFLRPDEHPSVRAVERRLRSLQARRAGAPPAREQAGRSGGEREPDADALWAKLQADHRVEQICMRAKRLTPEGQAAVLAIVDQILGTTDPALPEGEA